MKHALVIMLVLIVSYLTVVFIRAGLSADSLKTTSLSKTGQVKVLVQDQDGLPLQQVKVTIKKSTSGGADVAMTQQNDDGTFVKNVAAGDYSVTASSTGYTPSTQEMTIETGAIVTLNFYLQKQ